MATWLALLPWLVLPLLPIVFRKRPRLRDYPPLTSLDDPALVREGFGLGDAAPATSSTAPGSGKELPGRSNGELPLVSIIVPARNEAMNIGSCLAMLLDSVYPRMEIIAVDDGSSDGTGDIIRVLAERSGGVLRILEGEPLPAGWIGKPWACWQGYLEARGELLLFTDADTRHECESIARSVRALHTERADLLSIFPRQILLTFWERLIMPHVWLVISMRFRDLSRTSRARNSRDVIANGQFVLMRRDAYEAVDGHRGVMAEVVEDLRLAQRTVAAGKRLFLVHGEEWVETRMYRSLHEIVEGWSKNLAKGSRSAVDPWLRPLIPWALAALLAFLWVIPAVTLLSAPFLGVSAGVRSWALAAVVLSALFWMMICAILRVPVGYGLLFPLGGGAAAGLFVRSALQGENVVWKGRRYGAEEPLTPRRTPP